MRQVTLNPRFEEDFNLLSKMLPCSILYAMEHTKAKLNLYISKFLKTSELSIYDSETGELLFEFKMSDRTVTYIDPRFLDAMYAYDDLLPAGFAPLEIE